MSEKLIDEFQDILNWLKDTEFRTAVEMVMSSVPNYILVIPSSSTGKYHPVDEINPDGMKLHIRRVATFAAEMARILYDEEKDKPSYVYAHDILVVGALLHDLFKNGEKVSDRNFHYGIALPFAKYTNKAHPWLMQQRILTITEKDCFQQSPSTLVKLHDLAHVVLFHEGRWTTEVSKSKVQKCLFTKKTKELCQAMHFCDCLAVRRTIFDIFQEVKSEETGD